MDTVTRNLTVAITNLVLTEFINWLQTQNRPTGWKPSEADVSEFISRVQSDTPEKIKAEVAAETGG